MCVSCVRIEIVSIITNVPTTGHHLLRRFNWWCVYFILILTAISIPMIHRQAAFVTFSFWLWNFIIRYSALVLTLTILITPIILQCKATKARLHLFIFVAEFGVKSQIQFKRTYDCTGNATLFIQIAKTNGNRKK